MLTLLISLQWGALFGDAFYDHEVAVVDGCSILSFPHFRTKPFIFFIISIPILNYISFYVSLCWVCFYWGLKAVFIFMGFVFRVKVLVLLLVFKFERCSYFVNKQPQCITLGMKSAS